MEEKSKQIDNYEYPEIIKLVLCLSLIIKINA